MVFPLAITVIVIALALRRTRWAVPALWASRLAYAAFVVSGLLYFPARTGFSLRPPLCEWTFDFALAVHSLSNVPHIVRFAFFLLLTYVQLPGVRRALTWSLAACIVMGLLVELAQGVSGHHHCRMRDLIPDAVGALAGALIVSSGRRLMSIRRPPKIE